MSWTVVLQFCSMCRCKQKCSALMRSAEAVAYALHICTLQLVQGS